MDLWEVLGLVGILALWAAIGCVPWFGTLIATRGRAPWSLLPAAMLIAVGAAAIVPALGLKGWDGFWTSLAAALLLTTAAMLILTSRFQRLRGALLP